MKRREFLGYLAAFSLSSGGRHALATTREPAFRRVRPGDPAWPSEAQWRKLGQRVNGRLLRLHSPFDACREDATACQAVFARLVIPTSSAMSPALTQTSAGSTPGPPGRASTLSPRGTPPTSRRGQLRPQASPAPRRQGRRPQLPGHLQCAGFAADLDPRDERRSRSRRLRRRTDARHAAGRRHGRCRRPLGAGLRRGHDARRRLRAGRRLHHGRRRRA